MATAIVLMTAWMASVWLGRKIGLLSGFVLATMYEFYAYAILAEDDIFLAAIVALAVAIFVKIEFASPLARDPHVGFFGNRPWLVWTFFFVLGLSNMVKSPLVGAVVVIAPVAVFLLLACRPIIPVPSLSPSPGTQGEGRPAGSEVERDNAVVSRSGEPSRTGAGQVRLGSPDLLTTALSRS